MSAVAIHASGLRIKENKEVYEGEVTELTPEFTESEVSAEGCSGSQSVSKAAGEGQGCSPRATRGVKHFTISVVAASGIAT